MTDLVRVTHPDLPHLQHLVTRAKAAVMAESGWVIAKPRKKKSTEPATSASTEEK